MTNFIFKSNADLQKIYQQTELILIVLKQQRLQLDRTEYLVKRVLADNKLQKQVDDYFDRDETPPQTDTDEQ